MSPPHEPNPAPRVVALYLASFLVMGVYMPYWSLWLKDRGMSGTEIGWIMAGGVLMRLAAPWFAQRVDKSGRRRRAAVGVAITSIALFALFPITYGFVPLLLLCSAFGGTFWLLYPLTDAVASAVAREHYGRLRLWGSAGFIGGSFIAGIALEGRDVGLLFWLVLAGLVVSLGCSTRLPEPHLDTHDEGRPRRPFRELLNNRPFLAIAVGTGLVQASHAGLYGFGTLHWEALGVSKTMTGVLWAVGVMAEIALMFVSARVLRVLGPERLALIGGFAAIVRWIGIATATSLEMMIVLQTMHALTFGATHLALVAFIRERLPPRYSVTAQSVYAAVGTGLAMGGATLAAGPLFDANPSGMFGVMSGIAVAGTVLIATARSPRAARIA